MRGAIKFSVLFSGFDLYFQKIPISENLDQPVRHRNKVITTMYVSLVLPLGHDLIYPWFYVFCGIVNRCPFSFILELVVDISLY